MKHPPHPNHAPDEQDPDPELERAKELLDRTVRFLSHCMEDPESAMASEDPRELITGLQSLTVEPTPAEQPERPESLPEPRTIQIRRRRSA